MQFKKMFTGLFFLCTYVPVVSYSFGTNCNNINQHPIELKAANNANTIINVESCEKKDDTNNEEGQFIRVVFLNGDDKYSYNFEYNYDFYVFEYKNDVDLNNDGINDLAISNGLGPKGDGMNYFVYDVGRKKYTPVGDAPALYRSKFDDRDIVAIQSGSGDALATRYTYGISNGILSIVSAIRFIPVANNGYKVEFSEKGKYGVFETVKELEDVQADLVERCIAGKGSCRFDDGK